MIAAAAPWRLSDRFDPAGRVLADRHYNRQTHGSPQFVPPGRCLVLCAPGALWVTSWPEYAQHAWPGAWICSTFRNERRDLYLSSDLIRAAVAITRWRWPEIPTLGMVTFVDPSRIKPKRDPGRCFRRAGFVEVGRTKIHKLPVLRLRPEDMPPPAEPIGAQPSLWPEVEAS